MRISDWISDVCSSDLRHRHQRRPCRRDAGLLRQRQARRGRPLGRTETDPRRRAQVKLKSDPRPDETENEVNTLPALRLALLRSEEHTSELQSLMRISYAVFCLKKKKTKKYASIPTSQITKNI